MTTRNAGVERSRTCAGAIGNQPSDAFGINNRGQIVGTTFVPGGDDLNGFLSDNGGPLIALDTPILPASTIHVTTAVAINDRGEITGTGQLSDGSVHPVVLVPWTKGTTMLQKKTTALIESCRFSSRAATESVVGD